MKKFYYLQIFFVVLISYGLFFGVNTFASTTDGTVSGYAWSENIGWINFGATNGNIRVTDSSLTGNAWSTNKGWIKLDPTTSGVRNTSSGVLSGYAWGQNVGWINFSGVTINSSGEFTGIANGTNTGRINFDCTYCNVQTDWRPQSQRQDTGGGGALPTGAYNVPKDNFSIFINNGDAYTKDRTVILKFQAGDDVKKMAISNSPNFEGAIQENYVSEKNWILPGGDGQKTVYVKFFTEYGQSSQTYSDDIILDTTAPEIKITTIKDSYNTQEEVIIGGTANEPNTAIAVYIEEQYGVLNSDSSGQWLATFGKIPSGNYRIELIPRDSAGNVGKTIVISFSVSENTPITEQITPTTILEKIKTGLEFLIPGFAKPGEIKPVKVITVPKTSPLAMKNVWNILPMSALSEFVLAPLPKDLAVLKQKFPELEKTFEEVGVSKATDATKIRSANLSLPGLTQTLGLAGMNLQVGKFATPKGVPIASLTSSAKNRIPTDIVFAKTAGGLVDLNIALSLNEKGKTEQKISTITGQPLQLVIRVSKPAKEVIGYIVFKSKTTQQFSYSIPLNSLTASLSFANPDLTEIFDPDTPVVAVEGGAGIEVKSFEKNQNNVDQRLVLEKFKYQDTGEGVYTADIKTPVVDGEYEIITVVDYSNGLSQSKEIKLTTVIDPEGYVYEKDGDKETRIGGAIVSLYWLNPETSQYELWPARNYSQENPQTTDVRGSYSFLVPEGYYYITVDAPGYSSYDGKPFEVKEGSGVHVNIEMKDKYWWLKILDWKTALMIVIFLMLGYNFYKDKIREKTISKNNKI